MDFDIKNYLIENGLTNISDNQEGEFDKEIEDSEDDFESDYTEKDISYGNSPLSKVPKLQADLKDLESKKDSLLMQLRSNIISLDQYKQAIGNIPAQIKKLRADIERITYGNDEGEFAD